MFFLYLRKVINAIKTMVKNFADRIAMAKKKNEKKMTAEEKMKIKLKKRRKEIDEKLEYPDFKNIDHKRLNDIWNDIVK